MYRSAKDGMITTIRLPANSGRFATLNAAAQVGISQDTDPIGPLRPNG